jgi:hypothetical protein
MKPSVPSPIRHSSELDTQGLVMWLRLVNRCDELLYRFCRSYRRRHMFKPIRSR